MPKIVAVPSIGNIEFPDSMSDADIEAAIRKQFEPPPDEPKSVRGFAGNVLESTGNLAAQVGSAVTHPVSTLSAIGAIPVGIYEKLGGPLPAPAPGEPSSAQMLDAMIQHLKERYGGVENIKNTLYKDPVGAAADVSMLAGGGSGVLRGTGAVADALGATRTAAGLSDVADVAKTVSALTDPVSLATRGGQALVSGTVGKMATSTADSLRRSALRGGFTTLTPASEVENAVTAMREGSIPFSQQGIAENSAVIKALQQQKDAALRAAAQAGTTIPQQSILDDLFELRRQTANQLNPRLDLKQIDAVIDQVRSRLPRDIPVDLAEQLKEGTYSKTKWGQGAAPQFKATEEAEKVGSLALKRELESRVPELADLNPAQQRAINLDGILKQAVNKYIVSGGFKGNLKKGILSPEGLRLGGGTGAATGLLSGDPAAAAVVGVGADLLNAVLSDPAVKTRIAIAINQAQQINPAKWGAPRMATALSRAEEYLKAQ